MDWWVWVLVIVVLVVMGGLAWWSSGPSKKTPERHGERKLREAYWDSGSTEYRGNHYKHPDY